jgi:nucleotide-binding universal stress UspA family protein
MESRQEAMMKILAALDQSAYADFVLLKAMKTAKQQNAKLEIMVVAERADTEEENNRRRHAARECAGRARKKAEEWGIRTKALALLADSAAEALIQRAAEENLDLIVAGRRSKKGLDRFPMGSVSARLAAHAPCSVLIVR